MCEKTCPYCGWKMTEVVQTWDGPLISSATFQLPGKKETKYWVCSNPNCRAISYV